MSSINAISSAIPRLCGSAAIYGGRSTGRAARKRASTSWVRSVDAFASHVVRAWLRLVAPFSSYAVLRSERVGKTCARIGGGYRLAPARTASFDIDRAVERVHPRTSIHSLRSRRSRISHRPIRSSRRTPHRRKNSRRSEDQIIPIIDPPDQYAAASLAQAYLSDNDYRTPLPMRRRRTTISTRLSCLLDMHACRRRTSTFRRVLNFKDSRRFFRFRH
ncbi:hypothetical protein X986_200 [Burkholderia pseudomallei]|nr:hypothetical protein X984_1971 [Burkholderia pseudomallei]KGX29678.1 hypothetical protein X986_200 [Burkholderia pseudomallei]